MCRFIFRTTWISQKDTSEPCLRETCRPLKASRPALTPLRLSCSALAWLSGQVSSHTVDHVNQLWISVVSCVSTTFCSDLSFTFPSLSNNVVLSFLLGHDKLTAVKQQQDLFSDLRDKFARRLTNHLNNVFIHQVKC